MTRLQRASKGAGKSASRGSDDVVDCRGVFLERAGGNLVVFRDGSVYAKHDGRDLGGQIGPANGTLDPLHSHVGLIRDVSHPLTSTA